MKNSKEIIKALQTTEIFLLKNQVNEFKGERAQTEIQLVTKEWGINQVRKTIRLLDDLISNIEVLEEMEDETDYIKNKGE